MFSRLFCGWRKPQVPEADEKVEWPRKLSMSSDNSGVVVETTQPLPVRILTHNIRYDTKHLEKGEEPWPTRCPHLCAELVFHTINPAASFICLQEVLHNQLEDIQQALNHSATTGSSWSYIGVGRDDGMEGGEYSPILYRPTVWKLDEWKNQWLSETPDRPSKGWDAACNRIITIGIFTHQATRQKVVVMSTHLDHEGSIARQNSANMILKIVAEYQASSSPSNPTPVILAGDFNSEANDGAYKIMTSPKSSMVDVSTKIAKEKRYGHRMTYTAFRPNAAQSVIDFIFTNKYAACLHQTFGILENRFEDGVYLSDHRAVVADLQLFDY